MGGFESLQYVLLGMCIGALVVLLLTTRWPGSPD